MDEKELKSAGEFAIHVSEVFSSREGAATTGSNNSACRNRPMLS